MSDINHDDIDMKIDASAFNHLNHSDPVVRLLNKILTDAWTSERDLAMSPGITNEARTYNCGRAAAVLDLIEELKSNRWPYRNSVDFAD